MNTNNKNSAKVVHTLRWTPDRNPYKLGRGHEADVRVTNDISVSRLHMQIVYKDGDFIISDLKSKFGTLVLIKDDIKIHLNETKTVQVGRTVLSFRLRDQNSYNKHCFASYKKQDKNAENFFENDFPVPYFGMPEVSEDYDLPPQEVIDNHIRTFGIHNNRDVMKGTLLPRNQYRVNFDMIADGQPDMERRDNN
mmetsp:Transcript_9676/g.8520  ORF Transcript_9676/g.8520 Transcript_9676/m.8520 type:complete len:194 (+) Transcript_9676:845-1426(+)